MPFPKPECLNPGFLRSWFPLWFYCRFCWHLVVCPKLDPFNWVTISCIWLHFMVMYIWAFVSTAFFVECTSYSSIPEVSSVCLIQTFLSFVVIQTIEFVLVSIIIWQMFLTLRGSNSTVCRQGWGRVLVPGCESRYSFVPLITFRILMHVSRIWYDNHISMTSFW